MYMCLLSCIIMDYSKLVAHADSHQLLVDHSSSHQAFAVGAHPLETLLQNHQMVIVNVRDKLC